MNLAGKVVVVTGGGNGIGRQIVLDLLNKAAAVVAADINLDALNETKKLAGPLAEKISLHKTDISQRESVVQLVEEVIAKYGHVDIVINNAGVIHPFKPVSELEYAAIERMININFYGVINMCKEFLPLLLKRPEAHIVNLSSMGGLFAFPNQTFYGASKAAVKLLSEGLYAELKDTNVGVTVVYPGAINTNITKNNGAHNEKLEKLSKTFKGTSVKTAARCIINGIEKNRFRVLIGGDAKILSFLYRVAPRSTLVLVRKVMKLAMD